MLQFRTAKGLLTLGGVALAFVLTADPANAIPWKCCKPDKTCVNLFGGHMCAEGYIHLGVCEPEQACCFYNKQGELLECVDMDPDCCVDYGGGPSLQGEECWEYTCLEYEPTLVCAADEDVTEEEAESDVSQTTSPPLWVLALAAILVVPAVPITVMRYRASRRT